MAHLTVILQADPLERGWVGATADWPLHVTLVQAFRVRARAERVGELVEDGLGGLDPLVVTGAAVEYFGPNGDIEVTVLDAPARLDGEHRQLLAELSRLPGFESDVPAYSGDGYRPHVTACRRGSLEVGATLRLSWGAVIDMDAGPTVFAGFPLRGSRELSRPTSGGWPSRARTWRVLLPHRRGLCAAIRPSSRRLRRERDRGRAEMKRCSPRIREHDGVSAAARVVEPRGLATAVPYSYAATVPAGYRLIFLAGACPLDADGHTVAVGDVLGQATACVENMKVALAASGAELTDIVFVRVLVASAVREDLAAAWGVVHEALDPHEPPGTLQGVTVLGWADQLVEVEVVAAVRGE